MLARENRLKKDKDIKNVLRRGRPAREDFLFLKTLKNNLGLLRFVVVVGKKVSKRAVVRNKLRRRLSEVIRIRLKLNEIRTGTGTDGVIIVLPGAPKKDFIRLKRAIENLFVKAGLIK